MLGNILVLALIISALQGAVAILAISSIMLLLAGLIFKPQETWGVVALLLVLKGLEVNAVATIGSFMGLLVILLIANASKAPAKSDADKAVLLLTDDWSAAEPTHDPD